MTKRNLLPVLIALVVGGVIGGAVTAEAKRKGPSAEVRAPDKLCTKKHPKADVWVTELARGENAFVARLEMLAGGKVPVHRDATEEYIHVLQGTGKITIDGKTQDLGPGSTVYMPAKAEVSYVNGAENLVVLQVFAGPGPAKKYDAYTGCR
jgi:quercetin dioxygenase-like cupin family protein